MSTSSPAPGPASGPAPCPVAIQLLVEPSRLSMAERERFSIGLVATNTADAAIDPQLFATRLLVNGEPSPAFDLAIGNGVTPAGWDRLEAGASTHPVTWHLGEALLPEPGDYRLVLRLDVAGWARFESSDTVEVTA